MTGTSEKNVFPTPDAAEAAFYEAFERADISAMMEVWADDDLIECIHPMGNRLRGRDVVRRSWNKIFNSGARLKFSITEHRYTQDDLISVHTVYENISIEPEDQPQASMIATNVYQLTRRGWRIILHHASPSTEEKVYRDNTDIHERRIVH